MRTKKGAVIGTKMQKTVVVAVDTYKVHPLYRKRYRSTRKFLAHDENESYNVGDKVVIYEAPKMSKRKSWTVTPPKSEKA